MQKIACAEFAENNGWIIAKEFYEKGVCTAYFETESKEK